MVLMIEIGELDTRCIRDQFYADEYYDGFNRCDLVIRYLEEQLGMETEQLRLV